jgi:hypothetical protein
MGNNFKYGLGNKSIFTAGEILKEIGAAKEYTKAAGNGLNIAGLNIHSLDHVIRFSESTEKMVIMAPGLEPIEIDCEFTGEEDSDDADLQPAEPV